MTNQAGKRVAGGRRSRLVDKLARGIGEKILSGEFMPGQVLPNEASWGTTYGASRTAVRESIKILTAKGLIASRPKIGSKVEPRSRWNLLDRDVLDWHRTALDRIAFMQSTQEARRVIEPGVAGLAARKRTPQQRERLVAAVRAMGEATSARAFNEADVEFHAALLAAANNDLLMPFGIVIERALGSLFEFTSAHYPRPGRVILLHERIARAVAGADEADAYRAMIELLDDTDAIVRGRRRVRAKPRE